MEFPPLDLQWKTCNEKRYTLCFYRNDFDSLTFGLGNMYTDLVLNKEIVGILIGTSWAGGWEKGPENICEQRRTGSAPFAYTLYGPCWGYKTNSKDLDTTGGCANWSGDSPFVYVQRIFLSAGGPFVHLVFQMFYNLLQEILHNVSFWETMPIILCAFYSASLDAR